MAVVSLEEMKNYLRVDFDDDDALLEGIIVQSQQICMDVARFTDLQEFEKQPVSKIAVMYAVAYLYEHREDADHKALTVGLRALLFGIRIPRIVSNSPSRRAGCHKYCPLASLSFLSHQPPVQLVV